MSHVGNAFQLLVHYAVKPNVKRKTAFYTNIIVILKCRQARTPIIYYFNNEELKKK